MNLIIDPVPFVQVADYLGQAFDARTDTTLGMIGCEETCRGASVFQVQGERGEMIGAYALGYSEHDAGRVAWIRAAGGASGVDLTRLLVPAIEGQATGAMQLAIHTRRAGLVRKLLKQGYEITGVTLRKALKNEMQN